MGASGHSEEESSESGRSRERIDRKDAGENERAEGESINRQRPRNGGGRIQRTSGTTTVASASGGPSGGVSADTVTYDTGPDVQRLSDQYGIDFYNSGQAAKVQRLEKECGSRKVQRWADEGMTVDTMGKPRDMEAFRKRKENRSAEIPDDIERQNQASYQRNVFREAEVGPAGDAEAPDIVRNVISKPGKSLDEDVQREMESKMGGDFSDVQVHTGPEAAAAADSINARAFTVGNHVAFNEGEYDPGSDSGKKVLAHELTHVRQQTDGRISLLPMGRDHPGRGIADDYINVQPKLEVSSPNNPEEKEAEKVAREVVQSGDEYDCSSHTTRNTSAAANEDIYRVQNEDEPSNNSPEIDTEPVNDWYLIRLSDYAMFQVYIYYQANPRKVEGIGVRYRGRGLEYMEAAENYDVGESITRDYDDRIENNDDYELVGCESELHELARGDEDYLDELQWKMYNLAEGEIVGNVYGWQFEQTLEEHGESEYYNNIRVPDLEDEDENLTEQLYEDVDELHENTPDTVVMVDVRSEDEIYIGGRGPEVSDLVGVRAEDAIDEVDELSRWSLEKSHLVATSRDDEDATYPIWQRNGEYIFFPPEDEQNHSDLKMYRTDDAFRDWQGDGGVMSEYYLQIDDEEEYERKLNDFTFEIEPPANTLLMVWEEFTSLIEMNEESLQNMTISAVLRAVQGTEEPDADLELAIEHYESAWQNWDDVDHDETELRESIEPGNDHSLTESVHQINAQVGMLLNAEDGSPANVVDLDAAEDDKDDFLEEAEDWISEAQEYLEDHRDPVIFGERGDEDAVRMDELPEHLTELVIGALITPGSYAEIDFETQILVYTDGAHRIYVTLGLAGGIERGIDEGNDEFEISMSARKGIEYSANLQIAEINAAIENEGEITAEGSDITSAFDNWFLTIFHIIHQVAPVIAERIYEEPGELQENFDGEVGFEYTRRLEAGATADLADLVEAGVEIGGELIIRSEFESEEGEEDVDHTPYWGAAVTVSGEFTSDRLGIGLESELEFSGESPMDEHDVDLELGSEITFTISDDIAPNQLLRAAMYGFNQLISGFEGNEREEDDNLEEGLNAVYQHSAMETGGQGGEALIDEVARDQVAREVVAKEIAEGDDLLDENELADFLGEQEAEGQTLEELVSSDEFDIDDDFDLEQETDDAIEDAVSSELFIEVSATATGDEELELEITTGEELEVDLPTLEGIFDIDVGLETGQLIYKGKEEEPDSRIADAISNLQEIVQDWEIEDAE